MSKIPPPARNYLQGLRNIGIIAHIDAGKTTLTERILFYCGRIHRMGEVHDGTATMDFMPEEQERGITITSACTSCRWLEHTINLIDTPGHVDFTMEVERSLRVLDGAVGVFCAVGGVEPQSETVWRQSERYKVPKLIFINKMDRPGADFERTLASIHERLGPKLLPVTIPVGSGQDFSAVINIMTMEKLVFHQADKGVTYTREQLTAGEEEQARFWQDHMLELLADTDEAIMKQYLEGKTIAPQQVLTAVRRAVLALSLVPVFSGSALKNIGIQPLLDGVCHFLPAPTEVLSQKSMSGDTASSALITAGPKEKPLALVFKVTLEGGRKISFLRVYSGAIAAGKALYNATKQKNEHITRLFRLHAGRKESIEYAYAGEIVGASGLKTSSTGDTLCLKKHPVLLEDMTVYEPVLSLALEAQNRVEAEKLDEVLHRFLLEDPTLSLTQDENTEQYILSGMGELHLEVVLERLSREYGLKVRVGSPQVIYQETVRNKAEASARFERELGDTMHFGHVALCVTPVQRGRGVIIDFELQQDYPQDWLDAVEKGIQNGLQSGVVKGYPVQDITVIVTELLRAPKSSAIGYHMAGIEAVKTALKKAAPILLEPFMTVDITVPDEFVGEVISLLGATGAKVENLIQDSGQKQIQALAPLSRLFGFSTTLRSATKGRATMVMQFTRFDRAS